MKILEKTLPNTQTYSFKKIKISGRFLKKEIFTPQTHVSKNSEMYGTSSDYLQKLKFYVVHHPGVPFLKKFLNE